MFCRSVGRNLQRVVCVWTGRKYRDSFSGRCRRAPRPAGGRTCENGSEGLWEKRIILFQTETFEIKMDLK